ncbi:unknown [Akkermansia sp. CAG:344]|nr:unknown [Akkermansia sp. CAG:344]
MFGRTEHEQPFFLPFAVVVLPADSAGGDGMAQPFHAGCGEAQAGGNAPDPPGGAEPPGPVAHGFPAGLHDRRGEQPFSRRIFPGERAGGSPQGGRCDAGFVRLCQAVFPDRPAGKRFLSPEGQGTAGICPATGKIRLGQPCGGCHEEFAEACLHLRGECRAAGDRPPCGRSGTGDFRRHHGWKGAAEERLAAGAGSGKQEGFPAGNGRLQHA